MNIVCTQLSFCIRRLWTIISKLCSAFLRYSCLSNCDSHIKKASRNLNNTRFVYCLFVHESVPRAARFRFIRINKVIVKKERGIELFLIRLCSSHVWKSIFNVFYTEHDLLSLLIIKSFIHFYQISLVFIKVLFLPFTL